MLQPRLDGDQSRRMSMSQSKFSLSMTEMRANIRGGSKWWVAQAVARGVGTHWLELTRRIRLHLCVYCLLCAG